ncbi:hypothetical protein ACMGDM_10135 [Sphingomonas sp. DT-51]|uniref:hypothetical protein n=1 Tax=Sphingomonas sp. DT-51 TaxID=3396165 RepID=UPI003F1B7993
MISDVLSFRIIARLTGVDPASTRLRLDEVDVRPGQAGTPVGWGCVVAAMAPGAVSAAPDRESAGSWRRAIVLGVIGGGILVFCWWLGRAPGTGATLVAAS